MPIGTAFSPASMSDGSPMLGLYGFQADFDQQDVFATAGVAQFSTVGGGVTSSTNLLNGVININNAVNNSYQLLSLTGFELRYGKRNWFGARINVQDISLTGWYVGLTIPDSNIVVSIPNGVAGFICTEDDGTIDTIAKDAAGTTRNEQVDQAFTADDQWRDLKVIWNGNGRLNYYIDGLLVQMHSSNILTGTPMRFAIEIENAASVDLRIDYAYCWQER